MPLIKKLFFIIISIILVSCNKHEDSSSSIAWIGGEIVNPKLDYVILTKDYRVLDTIPLSKDNHFLYKIDSLDSGLYSFNHYEYQIIYLEKGDSLMLRVNTVDFDESLAFTGKGAERNNLLMEFFLINEAETKLMPDLYQLEPEEFQKKLDSLTNSRKILYDDFILKHPHESGFNDVAMANINYDSYIKKELYTSANQGSVIASNANEFPENFYAYRKKIDFGNDKLKSYYPYYRFLDRYFDNLACQKHKKDIIFDRYSFEHVFNKIKLFDSLITNDSLKVSLIRMNAINYLLNGKDAKRGEEIVALFSKISDNDLYIEEISRLAEAKMKLESGNKIPNIILLSSDNNSQELHNVIIKPTVLFFWSSQSMKHFKNIHSKTAELNSKYPEYDFIGINTDSHFKKWRGIVTQSGYDIKKEFQLENASDAEKKLLINSANKAIILDEKGFIIDGNISLFNPNIETVLLGN